MLDIYLLIDRLCYCGRPVTVVHMFDHHFRYYKLAGDDMELEVAFVTDMVYKVPRCYFRVPGEGTVAGMMAKMGGGEPLAPVMIDCELGSPWFGIHPCMTREYMGEFDGNFAEVWFTTFGPPAVFPSLSIVYK